MLKRNKLVGHFSWINPTIFAALGGAASVRVSDLIRAGHLLSLDAVFPTFMTAFGLGLSIALQVSSRRSKYDAGQDAT
ncbi:hypothetical protein [Rhodoferax ferrireducens]|uniref:hypothetical protein n=1 Tax=Rhodoferax ferrireducens TaxID=192843 RepID=UPI000318DE5E|nr:hypothetical protein [Rhodoferax ferrireducens]